MTPSNILSQLAMLDATETLPVNLVRHAQKPALRQDVRSRSDQRERLSLKIA